LLASHATTTIFVSQFSSPWSAGNLRESVTGGGAESSGRLIGGRYRLAAEIGRGSTGQVWRARDELLDRDVALKMKEQRPDF